MPKMPTDLPENDRALVVAAKAGLEWSPTSGKKKPTLQELADKDFVSQMHVLQANTIRALYLGLWDDVVVDPKGVRVTGARIDGRLNLSFGKGRGALSLQHCHFAEPVEVNEARLPALWLDVSHLAKGLYGDGVRIEGDLSCADGFRSGGVVRLLGAHIEGNLDFVCARLDSRDGEALRADDMVVTGGLYCRGEGGQGFHIMGAANLPGARIGGLMDWRPEQWTGRLNLSHAVVGQWRDAWGASAKAETGQSSIKLDHFAYGAFFSGTGMKVDSDTRIKWVEAAQGDNFTPGPYQTLARVLRAAGDDRGAAAVGLAKEKARTRHSIATCRADASHAQTPTWKRPLLWGRAAWMWFLSWLFNLFVGYGYYPRRGVGWLAGMLAAGWLVFWLGGPTPYGGPGHIKPADPVFIAQNHITKPGEYETSAQEEKVLERGHRFGYTLPVEYTPFSAFWYSFDTLVPLIDLGQEKAWSPSPLAPSFTKDPIGWLLLFYLYFHIIMGWVLTTLTVVAMTGLIKRDKEEE